MGLFERLFRDHLTREDHMWVWRLAALMIVVGLATSSPGIVDSFVMSQLSEYYLGAVAVGGNLIIEFLTPVVAVQQGALEHLFWLVMLPLLLTGLFLGTTYTREMRNSMTISALVYMLAWEFLLTEWGNQGLWLALTLFMLMRSLTLCYYSWRIQHTGGFVPAGYLGNPTPQLKVHQALEPALEGHAHSPQ